VALALLGSVLGGLAGFCLGRLVLLRAARMGLSEDARNLSLHGEELSRELHRVFRDAANSDSPYCSAHQLAALRAETFDSPYLKDIGRTRDGLLDCSAFLGRLNSPYVEGRPTLTLEDGTHIYTNVAVLLASSGGVQATVMDSGTVNVVLSPDAFDHWSRPHVRSMVAAYDRKKDQFAAIAGTELGIDSTWMRSPGFYGRAGVLYRSQCSAVSPVCAVTAESLADIWGWSRATQTAYTAMGALAGLGLGFALAILYLRQTSLRSQLRHAIRRDSSALRLAYQPILDVTSGRCVGAEALLRWKDQDGADVAPDVFIDLAEKSGFIGELTALVVRRATEEMGSLLREHPEITLSINVAASDMHGGALFALLEHHVREAGILPRQIILELTERSTADLGLVRNSIQRLAQDGYKVHVDDFGTGFSSLSYLDQLSVNAIKIDRAFTRTIGTDAVTAPILPQILAMAETLHLDVIVEGVETQAQMDFLAATDKPMHAQGWHYSRPMSAEALREFLREKEVSAPAMELNAEPEPASC
jgi:sensor c-di-GMP phosphodiesterase-like protein